MLPCCWAAALHVGSLLTTGSSSDGDLLKTLGLTICGLDRIIFSTIDKSNNVPKIWVYLSTRYNY